MDGGSAEIENAYVAAFFERQRLLWENYANDAHHDLSEVDAALAAACRAVRDGNDDPLLHRVLLRGTVDFAPEVAMLRNRLDDLDHYTAGGAASTADLAAAMEDDVVTLIELRNRLARIIGFASYGHLVMWSERLDFDAVAAFVAAVHASVLPKAADLVREAEMTLDTWWDDLAELAGPADGDVVASCRELAGRLGLDDLASRLVWLVRDQPIYGVAGVVSVPDDVRILLGADTSRSGFVVAFHELGHGLAHVANRGSGIDRTWDTVHDEAMATVLERIGVHLLFDAEVQERVRRIEVLETARMATSFLFEVALNEEPTAARDLFTKHYQPLVPVDSPVVWAADSFRSIDPFHIHAYVVGEVAADATLGHLIATFGDEPGRWGPWLAEHFYADGRRRSLIAKLAAIGDHLDPGVVALAD